jgi:alkylation response protein AidB-like acyl-CoA dehydrogenase
MASGKIIMDISLTAAQLHIKEEFEAVTERDIRPHAAKTDESAQWPAHTFAALKTAGLMGLHVPTGDGGRGEGLMSLALATESIGRACASSAISFGMHCVGTAVIAAKATSYHKNNYLRPIAAGEHVTTLSVSESGTGAHFYLPETKLSRHGDRLRLTGKKVFVTNAGHADSYVVSTQASNPDFESGSFTCLIVDRDRPGMEWLEGWNGLGMRGNTARGLKMSEVEVPGANLLGEEGDQIWYIFEVVAPYFLIAMAGTYLGVAQAAFDLTVKHLKERRHSISGESLAENPLIQSQMAEMWTRVERTRRWIYHAAQSGDQASSNAIPLIFGAKVEAAETAVAVTNDALTLGGGIAYRDNSELARLLRDARASHVMSPTTSLLKLWMGRALLGQPLL